MKAQILVALVEVVLRVLTPDLLEKAADKIIDLGEDAADKMDATKPLAAKFIRSSCKAVRDAFNIEDND